MDLGKAIESLKEFFLDIIGYFIPGLVFLGLLKHIFWLENISFEMDLYSFIDTSYLVVLIAYLFGYVLYGIGMITDEFTRLTRLFLKQIRLVKWGLQMIYNKLKIGFLLIRTPYGIQTDVENSLDFILVKNYLKDVYGGKVDAEKLSKLKVPALRSIVMSYIPEFDQKIYLFMFRSELCNYTGVALRLYSFLLALSLLNNTLRPSCDYPLTVVIFSIIIALVISYFLFKTRERFYSISYRIPFSLFLAKTFKLNGKS